MLKIGIDKMAFQAPSYYFPLEVLAEARQVESTKYTQGFMQKNMAICHPKEDVITLAAQAAKKVLDQERLSDIDLLLFATESAVDHSKSAGIYLHSLLNLPSKMRVLEVKQACYSSAAALYLAKQHIAFQPTKKVLLICSDLAKYPLNSPAEPTQGAGAVALLLSADPKLLILEEGNQILTEDVMDFWRPNYAALPRVDGALSIKTYLKFFETTYNNYLKEQHCTLSDFEALCFHVPYGKLAFKALNLALEGENDAQKKADLLKNFEHSLLYNQQMGNIYTGSLFLNFLSLIEQAPQLKPGDRIGFFAYGSGASGEFFTGRLAEQYKTRLYVTENKKMLSERKALTLEQYESFFAGDEKAHNTPLPESVAFIFEGIRDDKRHYVNRSRLKS